MVPPIVPSLCVYSRVTRLAQRDQIAPIMRATFTQRLLMVYLFSRHDNPTLKTQFTEGMLHSIFVTDPLPRTTVSLLRRLIPAILLIITVHLLLMLRTVTTVFKVRTARICAWSFRSPWHNHHLQYKSPARIAPSGLRSFYFRHYNYITGAMPVSASCRAVG